VAKHWVSLPHPDRAEPTVGRCVCGWSVVYRWGGHREAVNAAADHIEEADLAQPIELSRLDGEISVIPGASL
jgi:hypothetical protein